ncbi:MULTISPECIES: hypothetical protein [Brucella]|uniref:hypothetical protein n=1 Tax=Brucella TaxID=234 RepID=UPI0009F27D9E|nr:MULTISPECIES: hypothetical protein [Brucella]UWF66363.1 hypothetical protein NYO63_09160 [Brucella sp. 1315]UWF69487.1 hypothetical protein NYO65_09155 [Brucella sp. 2594]
MVIKPDNEGLYGGKARKLPVPARDCEKLQCSHAPRTNANIGETVAFLCQFQDYQVVSSILEGLWWQK